MDVALDVKWKLPGLYKGVDARKCYSEILEIGENATAKQILERAEDENSELHKCFEWDNTEAARKWREHQARQMVTHLVFTVQDVENKKPVNIRVLQLGENPHEYKQTKLIIQNKDEYAAMVSRAYRDFKALAEKYRTLSELENVITAIDELP